jgi:hypothetical protein
VSPGTRLANIGNMPDVQVSPAPRNAFRDAPKSAPQNVYFTEFLVHEFLVEL